MKFKHRALSLLLSLMIVLTFMPAMAYAIPLMVNTEGDGWSITSDASPVFIEGAPATLQVTTTVDGKYDLSYQWYVGDDDDNGFDWTAIEGETESSFVTAKRGFYACAVTWDEETLVQAFSVYKEDIPDDEWKITNDEETFFVDYGKSAKLTVETNYSGSDIEYQWSYYDYDEGDYKEIAGATSASYEPGVNVTGVFRCRVTADGEIKTGWYYVEFNTSDYEWETVYPDATAAYTTGDGRDLTVDLSIHLEENDSAYYHFNFPRIGDKITLTSGTTSEVYTYSFINEFDDEGTFVSEGGDVLYFDCDDLYGPQVNLAAGTLDTYVYSQIEYDHANKKVVRKYDTDISVPVNYITNIESISFEPGTITLDPEAVKWVDEDGVAHDDIFDLEKRAYHKDGIEEWYDCYADGDKITVTFNDGMPPVTYTYDSGMFHYIDGIWFGLTYPYIEDEFLHAGVNNVKIWYRGVYCTVKVIVASEHEHAWDSGSVTTAPTCTAAGVKTYKCTICGETKTESVAALGHDYKEVPNSAVQPTSEKAGKAADMECTRCHDKKVGAEIPKTDPAASGTPAAGTPVEPQKGESFKVSGATVKVTSSGTVAYAKAKSAKSVTVPATVSLNGKSYKVTEISSNAFKGTKATTVTIGKNVKKIKKNAFNGSKVKTLNIKSKLLTKKSVKGSLKGSKVKTVKVKVGKKSQNKTYVKKYKKIFTKSNAGKQVTVK